VHIIARSALRAFWEKDADSEQPLKAWFAEARRATCGSPSEIKEQYRSASVLRKQRVAFNIGGNKYRLVVGINFATQIVYVRFIGTHQECDKINAEEI
jgi:mRNA interferase HigB